MIELNTNLMTICDGVVKKLDAIDVDKMTRLQATTLMAMMRRRIHVDGLASDGMPIGSYSSSYLKYTRPKYGREEGSKVVLSLTRTMENGMTLFPIEKGTAIGYSTAELLQRARWQEKRECYGARPIFTPTDNEHDTCVQVAKDYIHQYISE